MKKVIIETNLNKDEIIEKLKGEVLDANKDCYYIKETTFENQLLQSALWQNGTKGHGLGQHPCCILKAHIIEQKDKTIIKGAFDYSVDHRGGFLSLFIPMIFIGAIAFAVLLGILKFFFWIFGNTTSYLPLIISGSIGGVITIFFLGISIYSEYLLKKDYISYYRNKLE